MERDLEDVEAEALGLLEEGVQAATSAWRNVTLGSVGVDGAPSLRTVVLRAFDRVTKVAEIHTDLRSAKMRELRANPKAELHGWDAARSVQLRARGTIASHRGDEIARAAWAGLHGGSRQTYRADPGPGSVIGDPEEAGPHLSEADAQENFVVLRLSISELEWLHIAKSGHRRALFRWEGAGVQGMWLAP